MISKCYANEQKTALAACNQFRGNVVDSNETHHFDNFTIDQKILSIEIGFL